MSEEDDWEEEETLVLVELSGILESDFKNKTDADFKVLGLSTDAPMLQFDNYTFSGHYEDTLGTCLLFEDKGPKVEKTDLTDGEIFQKMLKGANKPPTRDIEYSCHVSKKLCMTRAFLSNNSESSNIKSRADNEEHGQLNRSKESETEGDGISKFSDSYGDIPMSYDHDDIVPISSNDTLPVSSHTTPELENLEKPDG